MKIVMFGAGGVGGYFGGRLAQAGATSPSWRGARISRPSVAMGCGWRAPRAMSTCRPSAPATIRAISGPADVVLFTVKLYDAERAAAKLGPLIGPDTMVVTLQNGVDAVDIVARHVGREHTAGGVAYVAAVIDPPGTIRHTALDALIVGELDGTMSPRLLALKAAADRAGFGFTASPHILVDLWSKFARLSVFSAMTAITRSPLGVLRAEPELMAMLERAAWETIAVGRAHGIELTDGVMDEVLKMMQGMPPHAQSSMLSDLERQRPLELPWLSGAVARLGAEKQIPTPIHSFVATVLLPFVKGGPPAML